MKKRLIAFLLILVLAFSAAITTQASSGSFSAGSLNNFKVRHTYTSGQFKDVEGSAWYSMDVQAGYEFGLLNGVSADTFAPDKPLTTAEAVKLAVCLNSIYTTGTASFRASAPWYKTYIDEALKKGIISARPADPSAPVSRADFAGMIAKAMPQAFSGICQIADNAIPDVSMGDSFAGPVYSLYRAGVLAGCDKFGTFLPFDSLTRAEAAAIAARASDTDFRKTAALPQELSGKEIFSKCAPAVFYLERYDSEGGLMGTGSGFFISRDGLAVTNYHVISGASSAAITTADGKEYAVRGICGYDKTKDVAVLQVDGSGFSYLDIADSGKVGIGAHVYAIGSPYGLINTISDGIVSNVPQSINNSSFIQYSAPISMGSGGGPVLNTRGQVVGIACLTVQNGQTLNFAVPSNDLQGLSRTDSVPLISIVAKNSDALICYNGYFPVPDYGIFVGTPIYRSALDKTTGVKTYYYKLSDITAGDDMAVTAYTDLLKQLGFEWQSTYTNDGGYAVGVYHNANFDMSVHFGMDKLDGVECRFVAIY